MDMLTFCLNAAGFEIAHGDPLSYNWVCGGWPRDKMADNGLGDIARWMGFLKCYYTAGMVGANVGYYDYPPGGFAAKFAADNPPHWLRQLAAAAQVHALFSHLEPFLREGDLLPGPNMHRWSKTQPAYEFPTGDAGTRVLARKLRGKAEWLITAWAADGQDREVKVTLPKLAEVTLLARVCGSVYHVIDNTGQPVLELIDKDGVLPTAALSEK